MYDVLAVFHGGTDEISHPDVKAGRPRLDFGPGFYVTDIYTQAKEWAYRIADRRGYFPVVNTYHLNKKEMVEKCVGIQFDAYNRDWLEFVTNSRLGYRPWKGMDYVEGGVADDNVVDTVRLFMNGFISAEDALQRLQYFKPTNQICILSQEAVNRYLKFIKADRI